MILRNIRARSSTTICRALSSSMTFYSPQNLERKSVLLFKEAMSPPPQKRKKTAKIEEDGDKIALFIFRRDLRLADNSTLIQAIKDGYRYFKYN
jgi:hypothetical protein